MDNRLNLSNYELSLVGEGLQIMLIENAKDSNEVTEKQIKQQYESFGLELFTLLSKVKLPDIDKGMNLTAHELKLMKSGLMFLADYIYQKSLKITEKNNTKYYEECNLQLVKVRHKIDRMESYTYKLC